LLLPYQTKDQLLASFLALFSSPPFAFTLKDRDPSFLAQECVIAFAARLRVMIHLMQDHLTDPLSSHRLPGIAHYVGPNASHDRNSTRMGTNSSKSTSSNETISTSKKALRLVISSAVKLEHLRKNMVANPVNNADQTLKAEVSTGGTAPLSPPLEARYGNPGKYASYFVPSKVGTYTGQSHLIFQSACRAKLHSRTLKFGLR
jgi:hypothetical protein